MRNRSMLKVLRNLTRLFQNYQNYSKQSTTLRVQYVTLTTDDKKHYAIWDVINQKEEVEHVAKAIRHKLYQGYRYKDILVLLGDVDSYRLQIGKIFDKYDIPYYFGKAVVNESTTVFADFIDSLERGSVIVFVPRCR